VTLRQRTGAVMLKFISAVIIAAASAGVLTLLSATSTRLDALGAVCWASQKVVLFLWGVINPQPN
jgi:hypothetical protein